MYIQKKKFAKLRYYFEAVIMCNLSAYAMNCSVASQCFWRFSLIVLYP